MATFQVSIMWAEPATLSLCRLNKACDLPDLCRVGGASQLSAHSLVFPAAAVAGHATVVAGSQGSVAAHAGRHQGQTYERHPAQAEALVAGVAGARVGVVTLRVRHAVVQQAVSAPHEADPSDAGLDGVRRLLAAPPPIVLLAEYVLTVNAAERRRLLCFSFAFGWKRLWRQRHH